MNVNMEQTSFTSMLEHSQFGPLEIQPLHQSTLSLQDMTQPLSTQFIKQQDEFCAIPASMKLPADQSVPNMLQNMISRSNSYQLTPSSTEASILSLVDGELRVSSISNLPIFLKILQRCKTEPEQTLALVVLRATSTSTDHKLSHACASAFEKSGGLRLARAWVDSAVTWQYNELLVLLLEVLRTLPLQLTSITEARINEPIVKLRKQSDDERVKRAAQDLLKFWRGKFTEKDKSSVPSSATKNKTQDAVSTEDAKSALNLNTTKSGPQKLSKVLKKRTIKRLERLPFGGGSAVSKSSDLIGNLMQRKSAKEAAAAAEAEKKKNDSKADDIQMDDLSSIPSNNSNEGVVTTSSGDDDTLSIPLPTIQSFKAASSSTSSSKQSKRIRWADEHGVELVKVKLIESWRDLVPYDPRHDGQSFKDAKLREHANERNALLAQHHKIPPAVAASQSREWTSPAFMRLPPAVAARVNDKSVTDEMHVQDSRRRHVDEYEVLVGEMPIPSPKEWERGKEPPRGPPLEIPLSDVVGSESNTVPPPTSTPMAAPPSSSTPFPPNYGQIPPGFGFNPSTRPNPEVDRKLREALGPLQDNTIALLLSTPDVVPHVLEEAQHHGNRIPDARIFQIVEQYRRGQYQAPPNGPTFSPYNPEQYLGEMPPGQYHSYPRHGPMGTFVPGKRKAEVLGVPQNGLMQAASLQRPVKKNRGTLPCRYFASPMGCKHGVNCHFAHVQLAPTNGPELIYTNGPMIGRGPGPIMGPGPMERYGPVPHGLPGHHMRGR